MRSLLVVMRLEPVVKQDIGLAFSFPLRFFCVYSAAAASLCSPIIPPSLTFIWPKQGVGCCCVHSHIPLPAFCIAHVFICGTGNSEGLILLNFARSAAVRSSLLPP